MCTGPGQSSLLHHLCNGSTDQNWIKTVLRLDHNRLYCPTSAAFILFIYAAVYFTEAI
uniref:Uncharacterized protein n=1 Tax=Anguilla anguilla TaxID=7936 RepID=A0A0E9PTT3_ANGAN